MTVFHQIFKCFSEIFANAVCTVPDGLIFKRYLPHVVWKGISHFPLYEGERFAYRMILLRPILYIALGVISFSILGWCFSSDVDVGPDSMQPSTHIFRCYLKIVCSLEEDRFHIKWVFCFVFTLGVFVYPAHFVTKNILKKANKY